MLTQDNKSFPFGESANEATSTNSGLSKYLFHWPLFLISILIILPAAYFYVSSITPIYEVKASILIKDTKKNQSSQSSSALHEIDLITSAKTVDNEIEILKSKKLITRVVDDLKLWVNYRLISGFKKIDLFKETPVEFVFLKKNVLQKDEVMEITIKDKTSYDVKLKDGQVKSLFFDKSYNNQLGSWKLVATDKVNDYIGKTILVALSSVEASAIQYQNAIDASLSNKLSTALVISISDQNAERGEAVLDNLIQNYSLASVDDKNKDLKATIDFLDQKIKELSGDLGASERGLENFKSSKGLTDISLQSKVSLENLQNNDNQLNEANIQLQLINRIDEYVNASQNSDKVPSANGIDDPSLSSLIDKLSGLQLQYQELAANIPETSPDFDPINRQIRTTKATIKETVKNIKISLRGKRDKLQSYNSNFESSIKSIPTQEREYINIKREQSSKESLYTYYLQKREEAAANYASILTDDKIIDDAYAGVPKNNTKMIYLIAMFATISLPTGFIYIRNAAKNKVISPAEIKKILKSPIIAEIPYESGKNKIAINNKFSTPTSEQFRSLRTRLHYLHKDRKQGRVTLVTSSVPGEGKSFVSTNISVSLAYTERKTIILELDMRKPKIMETFNLPSDKKGLSDYFDGNASIEDIIQPSGIDSNLFVISSGSPISNPSELLERKGLSILISTLRERFDDIIIDSPPTHLVADAMIVSPFTDVCLYVIRQGYTDKAELTFISNLIEQQQLSEVNIIFNGLQDQRHGYGYHYSSQDYYTKGPKRGLSAMFSDFGSRF